jgi:hypothetical protein
VFKSPQSVPSNYPDGKRSEYHPPKCISANNGLSPLNKATYISHSFKREQYKVLQRDGFCNARIAATIRTEAFTKRKVYI